jgi:hypothetical protein
MSFAYYDDMINAFPAERTDQPFSISVLAWGAATSAITMLSNSWAPLFFVAMPPE